MVLVAGHRGYKGKYAENTMVAFEKAYSANVDIIELDLQMTADGIIIINHDSNTRRTWNTNYLISNTQYSTLTNLRNKQDPLLHIVTLENFLHWLLKNPNVQVILDIKFTNNKLLLLKTFSLLLSINDDIKYWQKRIIFGLWMLDWYQYGFETGILKDFRILAITLSTKIIDQFLEYSNLLDDKHFKLFGISVHHVAIWSEPFRLTILPKLKKNDIKLFAWTVNTPIDFKMISQIPGLFGVITDFPKEAQLLLKEYHDPDSKAEKFILPDPWTPEGRKVRFYLFIYKIVSTIILSKWVHYQICGLSIAHLFFWFLKAVSFI